MLYKFLAHRGAMEMTQFFIYFDPEISLFRSVVYLRYFLAKFVLEGDLSEIIASFAILLILELGMVFTLLDLM